MRSVRSVLRCPKSPVANSSRHRRIVVQHQPPNIHPVFCTFYIFSHTVYLPKWLNVYSVDDVSSSIKADIRDHATCAVKTFLDGLLSLCLLEEHEHNPPVDLLERCINAVLPICNPHCRPIETKRGQKRADEEAPAGSLELRKHLKG